MDVEKLKKSFLLEAQGYSIYSVSEERQINETGSFSRIMEAKYLLSSLNLSLISLI